MRSLRAWMAVALLWSWTESEALDMESAARLGPSLRAAMTRIEDGASLDAAARALGPAGVEDGRIPCFVRFSREGVAPGALGIRAQTAAGRLCTARLTPEEILRLAGRPEVARIEMGAPVRLLLDDSIPEIAADVVQDSDMESPPTYAGLTGQGVVVGIVDSGIDHAHPDFWEAGVTRIHSLWDQTNGDGPPPDGFAYGTECDASVIQSGACPEDDTDGHGTHVAGIAAGNGAGTGQGLPAYTYVGTAPEADLVIVKTTLSTPDVVDGVAYVFAQAAGLGQAAVVNLSLGSHVGPHDGTDDIDEMLNALVAPGRIIVAAAGNETGDGIHAETLLIQDGTQTVTFDLPAYTPDDGADDFVVVDAWYPGGTEVSLTVTTPNGHEVGPVAFGGVADQATDDGTVYAVNAADDPSNGDENIYIQIDDFNGVPPASGTWTLEIQGTVVPAGAGASELDLWLGNWSMPSESAPAFVTGLEEEEIVGSPASADSVVAVGSYVTKAGWSSVDGNDYIYNPPVTLGDISPFSSIGPRRDGAFKPDVAAPGQGIHSTMSADMAANTVFIAPDSAHVLNQGTSMACPHVTGVVAMMLQGLGSLGPDDVISQFRNTSREDGFTEGVPNSTWGWGKIDAEGATTGITPVLVSNLEAVSHPWGVAVFWRVSGDYEADGFRALRSLDTGVEERDLWEEAVLAGEVGRGIGVLEDRTLTETGRYAYWIQPVSQGEPEAPAGPVYVEWARQAIPALTLHPATPNPFRPETTLRLELARPAEVLVEIINPAGRRVRTVADGHFLDGIHRLEWDGRDGKGRELGSGLYFVRVRAGREEKVGRLILIR